MRSVGPRPPHLCAIDVERARRLVGHEATAAIASELLGQDIRINRIPEGAVLTREQVEAIGYVLVLLEAVSAAQIAATYTVRDICLDLLSVPDDVGTVGEQTPGTRRRGTWPLRVHYVVRRPAAHGGGYVFVMQEHGTDAWE